MEQDDGSWPIAADTKVNYKQSAITKST